MQGLVSATVEKNMLPLQTWEMDSIATVKGEPSHIDCFRWLLPGHLNAAKQKIATSEWHIPKFSALLVCFSEEENTIGVKLHAHKTQRMCELRHRIFGMSHLLLHPEKLGQGASYWSTLTCSFILLLQLVKNTFTWHGLLQPINYLFSPPEYIKNIEACFFLAQIVHQLMGVRVTCASHLQTTMGEDLWCVNLGRSLSVSHRNLLLKFCMSPQSVLSNGCATFTYQGTPSQDLFSQHAEPKYSVWFVNVY